MEAQKRQITSPCLHWEQVEGLGFKPIQSMLLADTTSLHTVQLLGRHAKYMVLAPKDLLYSRQDESEIEGNIK